MRIILKQGKYGVGYTQIIPIFSFYFLSPSYKSENGSMDIPEVGPGAQEE
jgi:hypothetical protein